MSITMHRSRDEIGFTISGAILQRILDWKYILDKKVFDEQLNTGSFHGRCPVDEEMQTVMQLAKTKGHIMPYYGVGGSRGSCIYSLQWAVDSLIIEVKNETVEETIRIADHEVEVDSANMISEEPQIVFRINGKELEVLRQWEYWREDHADTSRYIYRFGQVAMGRLGYTIKIEDTETGNKIDVTAYEDW